MKNNEHIEFAQSTFEVFTTAFNHVIREVSKLEDEDKIEAICREAIETFDEAALLPIIGKIRT